MGIETEEEKSRRIEDMHFWQISLLALCLGVGIIAVCVLLAGCSVRIDARWAEDARGLETDNDRHQLENILEDTSEMYEDDEIENKK